MKKHTLQLTLAMLLVGSACSAFAASPPASSAQVVVTGRVTDATCDIGTQGLSGNKLDLGAHAPAAFVNATTLVGTKPFQVGLSNCTGTEASGKNYGLSVSGDGLASDRSLFADSGTQTVGIKLQNITTGTPVDVSAAGAFIPLGKDEKAASADGQVVLFQASMVHPSAVAPAVQDVQGTILFTADYQ